MPSTRHTKQANHSATLARIIEAGREEFGARGIDLGTVTSIAAKAGTSQQMVYHYFKNKQELYAEIIERIGDEIYQPFEEVLKQHPSYLHALATFVLVSFDVVAHIEIALIRDQICHSGSLTKKRGKVMAGGDQMKRYMRYTINGGIEAGLIAKHVVPENFFISQFLMVTGFFASRDLLGRYLDYDCAEDAFLPGWKLHAVESLLRSIATPAGHELIPDILAQVRQDIMPQDLHPPRGEAA